MYLWQGSSQGLLTGTSGLLEEEEPQPLTETEAEKDLPFRAADSAVHRTACLGLMRLEHGEGLAWPMMGWSDCWNQNWSRIPHNKHHLVLTVPQSGEASVPLAVAPLDAKVMSELLERCEEE